MKKLSIFMAMAAVALGFSSCSTDHEPVYHNPAEGSFVLNTPALADQYFELTEEGTLEFTTSQPDYGFTASVNYSVEMAVVENPEPEQIKTLTTSVPTSAVMVVKDNDVAVGMCELLGIDSEEAWGAGVDAMPVYFRAVAFLPGHEAETKVVSNWVKMNQIKPYFAVPLPGYIYLIGDCGGWVGPDAANAASLASWRLFEDADAIGSKIYKGTFDVPAGKAKFRFYLELKGWGNDGCPWGLGYIPEDQTTDLELVDNRFECPLVYGKGNLHFTNWEGGQMTIIVNMASEDNITCTIIGNPGEGGGDTPEEPVGDPFKVYFDNAGSNWNPPYVHYWGGAAESSWPGAEMTLVDGDIWVCEVPAGTTGLVFNNGGQGEQTTDFTAAENHLYDASGDQGEYAL